MEFWGRQWNHDKAELGDWQEKPCKAAHNSQCPMSSIVVVQQMIKWVTCSMVHSELGYQKPFGRFIAYDMRVEQCGKHIIQPSVDRTQAFPMGSGIAGNYGCRAWKLGDAFYFSRPNQAFKGSDICGNAWACWSLIRIFPAGVPWFWSSDGSNQQNL